MKQEVLLIRDRTSDTPTYAVVVPPLRTYTYTDVAINVYLNSKSNKDRHPTLYTYTTRKKAEWSIEKSWPVSTAESQQKYMTVSVGTFIITELQSHIF